MEPQRPTYYIPIHGTWAIDEKTEAWWKITGPFARYAKRFNMFQWSDLPPFIWSSDLAGIGYNLFSARTKRTDWHAGGWALYYYLNQIPLENRNLIIHSHGLQVVSYCASFGMKINNMISVCSPIRNDMDFIYDIARLNIKNHLHIYDTGDRIQFLGSLGDGRVLGSRKSPHADVNIKLCGINHSDVLKVEGRMDLWIKEGWFDYLRQ